MVIVLDTNILIDVFRGRKEILKILEEYREEIFAITSITLFELWQGNLKDIEAFVLESLPKYYFDDKSAKLAGIILKKLKKTGRIPEIQDLFIASICISNNLMLLTRDDNFKLFKPFGLKVKILKV